MIWNKRITYLCGVTTEVVGGLDDATVALLDEGISAVVRLEDGELPALRKEELDVELTVGARGGRG